MPTSNANNHANNTILEYHTEYSTNNANNVILPMRMPSVHYCKT